jgi:DNA-binding response OmpR family regulator
MKILAVDDDLAVLKAIEIILESSGHEVDCTDQPAIAVEMVAAGRYDMILFDYMMGELDGIWFLQNISLPQSTKAVLMTGYGTRNLIDRVFELGASGYLMKPFSAAQLLKHVEYHGEGRHSPGVLTLKDKPGNVSAGTACMPV